MLSNNSNIAPCLSLKFYGENHRYTGIKGNGNGNGGGNLVAALSDSIPADNFPTPGEYGGAEATGILEQFDLVACTMKIHLKIQEYLQPIYSIGGNSDNHHLQPAVKSYQLNSGITPQSSIVARIVSKYRSLESAGFLDTPAMFKGGGGRKLSANNVEAALGLGGCTVDLTRGHGAAAATVVQKRRVPGLTFEFDDDFPDVAKLAVLRALESWEEPLNFTFSWKPGNADIVLGMYSGAHGDGQPFKFGPGGVLAHATVPPHGDIHFNSDQPWWFDPVPPPKDEKVYDFQSVAAHEIGHVLGMEHIDDPKAVMYEFIELGETRRGLTGPDVAQLEYLYSGDPNFD